MRSNVSVHVDTTAHFSSYYYYYYYYYIIIIIKPRRMHSIDAGWAILRRMSHVAWSVRVCVFAITIINTQHDH